MAVMMVTGNNPAMFPDPIWNIFSLISTITGVLAAQIPEAATDSLLYQSLFLLAVVLLVMVLVINFASRYIIKSMNRKLGNADPHDSIIYKLTGREKLLNGAVDDFLADKKELIIEVVVYVCTFVFVWMMSTLFTGDVASIIVAAVVCVLVFAIRKLMNTVNSTTVQQIAHGSLTVVMGFVVLILVFIIGYILINGIPAIDKDFITGTPTAGGMGGGILPMIVGVRSVRNGIHCQGARYRGVHGCRMVCSCIHDNACYHQDNRGSTQICSSRAKGSFAGNGCKQVEDHIQGRDPCCHGRGAYRNNPFARSCSRGDGTDYVHCSGVHIFHSVCGHDIRACSRSAVSSVLPSNTERSCRDAVRYSDYPVAHRSVHVPARVCNQISLQQESQMVIVWNSNSKGRGWSKKWHPSNLP